MFPLCLNCGRKTLKEEICSECRLGRTYGSRAEINKRASIEQEMTKEEASILYEESMERIREDGTDQEAWHNKRRAVARLKREKVDENTLI